MSKKIRIAILGLGNRGEYFSHILKDFTNAEVTAIADLRDYHRTKIGDELGIPEEHRFSDWHALLSLPERVADAVIIALQDALHCEAACAMASKGYHLFLEKPMAPTWEECLKIADAAEQNNVTLTICHELRYTLYFQKFKEILDSGAIGKIQNVQHFESVGYWHQAHSFVRGNWRNQSLSTFMLLAKSCHDMDILSFLIGKKCLRVSSFGSLNHFRPECAPAGAAKRCTQCPAEIESKCPYSALKIYLRERAMKGEFSWPVDVITDNLTIESVTQAIQEGPYGRCVYACDNDVVDHQVVNLEFADGITAVFTMSAFSRGGIPRETKIGGTLGEIIGDGETIQIHRFIDNSCETINTNKTSGDITDGHGGGDWRILEAWVQTMQDASRKTITTGPKETLESHHIAFAAEKARLTGSVITL